VKNQDNDIVGKISQLQNMIKNSYSSIPEAPLDFR